VSCGDTACGEGSAEGAQPLLATEWAAKAWMTYLRKEREIDALETTEWMRGPTTQSRDVQVTDPRVDISEDQTSGIYAYLDKGRLIPRAIDVRFRT